MRKSALDVVSTIKVAEVAAMTATIENLKDDSSLVKNEPQWTVDPESMLAVEKSLDKAIGGVPIGGAAGGAIFALIFFVAMELSEGRSKVLEFLCVGGAAVIVTLGISLVATALTGVVAHIAVLLLNWALGGALSRRAAIVIMAGASGFLPLGAILASDLSQVRNPLAALIMLASLFVFMSCCQAGALYVADRWGVWSRLAVELKSSKRVAKRIQFGTQQLLVMTAIVAFVFALDASTPNHEILIAVGVYCVLQSVLLLIDFFMFRRVKQRLLKS